MFQVLFFLSLLVNQALGNASCDCHTPCQNTWAPMDCCGSECWAWGSWGNCATPVCPSEASTFAEAVVVPAVRNSHAAIAQGLALHVTFYGFAALGASVVVYQAYRLLSSQKAEYTP